MKRLTGLAMGAAVLFCSLGAFGQHGGHGGSRRRAWWHYRYKRLRLDGFQSRPRGSSDSRPGLPVSRSGEADGSRAQAGAGASSVGGKGR